jgi:predicted acetyltransferase
LNEKLKKWAKPFFWMLTQYHKEYRKNGYTEPEAVLVSTKGYRDEHDIYAEFISVSIEKSENDNDILYLDDLYQIYCFWHKKTIADRGPTRREFHKNIEIKIGTASQVKAKKFWKGYKILEDENMSQMNFYDGV